MRIGEAAAEAGLEATAIRFYEKQGVLPEPARTDSGYRDYRDEDVDLLRFVRRARHLGIALDDVRQIVELRTRGQAPCEVVRRVIADEAVAIDARIAELQVLRDELTRLRELADRVADDWPGGHCVCHIVEAKNDADPKRMRVGA